MATRYLAIDLGDKRTGLAIGDDVMRIASPVGVIEATTDALRLDRLAEAERHFTRAIALNPDLLPPHYGLGLILLGSDRHEQAAGHFRAVINLQPRFAEAHHQLGLALLRSGQKQSGLSSIQQALRLDPLNQAARKSLAAAMEGRTP